MPGQLPLINKNFREFDGINTQAARQAIRPTQFSWLENAMPIGHGNLKVVKQVSAVRQAFAAEAYYTKGFIIGSTAYMFYAFNDGSAYQMLASAPYTTTLIAAPGTFTNGSVGVGGVQIAQWKTERILIINSTAPGYYDWNGAVLTPLGGVGGAPSGGDTIATYGSRVWISNARTLSYSDVASYTSFAGAGGNTIISDESFSGNVLQTLSANNFLYIFSGDSINVIADVQVVGGVTQFSNTNISANSGSEFPLSIIPYYRAIWYMNRDGIFALYGATPRKASDELDGIFQRIDFSQFVSAGTVSLYNILCVAFMFTYNDPNVGARKIIAIYFNKRWFIASQGDDLSVMASSHGLNAGGTDTLFSAGGSPLSSVFELFNDSTSAIDSKVQTALWDMDDFIRIKEAMRLGIEANVSGDGQITPTVDNETFSQSPQNTFSGSFAFDWFNSIGQAFSWLNSLGQQFTWLSNGYVWFQGDVETSGHYLGITSESTGAGIQYSGFQLQYRLLVANWGD